MQPDHQGPPQSLQAHAVNQPRISCPRHMSSQQARCSPQDLSVRDSLLSSDIAFNSFHGDEQSHWRTSRDEKGTPEWPKVRHSSNSIVQPKPTRTSNTAGWSTHPIHVRRTCTCTNNPCTPRPRTGRIERSRKKDICLASNPLISFSTSSTFHSMHATDYAMPMIRQRTQCSIIAQVFVFIGRSPLLDGAGLDR